MNPTALEIYLSSIRFQFSTLASLMHVTSYECQDGDITLPDNVKKILNQIEEYIIEIGKIPYGTIFQVTIQILLTKMERLVQQYLEDWDSDSKSQIIILCEGAATSLKI